MKPTLRHKLTSATLLCCFAATAGQLQAQTLLSESFQAPLNDIPADWSVTSNLNTNKNIVAWGFDAGAATNGLRFQRQADTSDTVGNAYYAGPNATAFSDFTGSIIFQATGGSQYTGVLLRASNPTSFTPNGYFIGVANRNTLFIGLNPTSHTNFGTNLDSESFTNLGNSNTYRLEFSAIGSSFEADLFQWNTTTLEWQAMASVNATNETYSSGRIGVRGTFGATGTATFGNLEVSAIPEPGHYAIGVALLALVGVCLHRRRQYKS